MEREPEDEVEDAEEEESEESNDEPFDRYERDLPPEAPCTQIQRIWDR